MQTLEFAPIAGQPLMLCDGLRMILAPNPSPMTYLGTNTFILGKQTLCVIDPGPDSTDHLNAILAAIGTGNVSHIIVTHNHLDHSPLAKPLSEATGAKIYAFGDHHAGRSAIMKELSSQGLAGGGEGIDSRFKPDVILQDGEIITRTYRQSPQFNLGRCGFFRRSCDGVGQLFGFPARRGPHRLHDLMRQTSRSQFPYPLSGPRRAHYSTERPYRLAYQPSTDQRGTGAKGPAPRP